MSEVSGRAGRGAGAVSEAYEVLARPVGSKSSQH